MKFSACMLVSRTGELMRRAFRSILDQEPDEIRIYLDPLRLGEHLSQVRTLLEEKGAKVFVQEVSPDIEDHHEDVVHSVHRALLEAENKWVAWNDDDDEILGDRRTLLKEQAQEDVGVIYGDVLSRLGDVIQIRRTRQVSEPREVNRIIGSGTLYNRDAFREIHHMVDHGYFWDFKIFYWVLRAGYQAVHVPKITSLQNVNVSPSKKRIALRRRWPEIAGRLDKVSIDRLDKLKY